MGVASKTRTPPEQAFITGLLADRSRRPRSLLPRKSILPARTPTFAGSRGPSTRGPRAGFRRKLRMAPPGAKDPRKRQPTSSRDSIRNRKNPEASRPRPARRAPTRHSTPRGHDRCSRKLEKRERRNRRQSNATSLRRSGKRLGGHRFGGHQPTTRDQRTQEAPRTSASGFRSRSCPPRRETGGTPRATAAPSDPPARAPEPGHRATPQPHKDPPGPKLPGPKPLCG
jgi:hypothetical protein